MTPWITKPVPFNIGQSAAAAGEAPCVEEYYNLPDETTTNRSLGVGREGGGFEPTTGNDIFEKTVASVTVKLDNDGRSPDETISVRARNSTSGAIVGTFGQMDATNLTSSIVEYTFDTNQITLSSGDMITVEYPITSGDIVNIQVYPTVTTNYVSNADTFVSTGADLTNWVTWQDGYSPYNYYWIWLKVIYCP